MKLVSFLIGLHGCAASAPVAAPRALPAGGYRAFEAESAANQSGFAPLTVNSDSFAKAY